MNLKYDNILKSVSADGLQPVKQSYQISYSVTRERRVLQWAILAIHLASKEELQGIEGHPEWTEDIHH